MDELISHVFSSQWRVIFIVTGLLLLLAEWGFRLGLRLHGTSDEARKGQIGTGVMKILNSHKQKLMLFLFFSLRQNTLCFSCSAGFPPAHPCTSPLPSSQAWQPMPL